MFERKPPYTVAGRLPVCRNALFISVKVVFGVPNDIFTLLRGGFCLPNLGLLVVEAILEGEIVVLRWMKGSVGKWNRVSHP